MAQAERQVAQHSRKILSLIAGFRRHLRRQGGSQNRRMQATTTRARLDTAEAMHFTTRRRKLISLNDCKARFLSANMMKVAKGGGGCRYCSAR
jgi:hypothetical protein